MKRYVRMSRIMSRAPPICSTNYKSDVSRQMITDIERDVISGRTSRSLSLSLSSSEFDRIAYDAHRWTEDTKILFFFHSVFVEGDFIFLQLVHRLYPLVSKGEKNLKK